MYQAAKLIRLFFPKFDHTCALYHLLQACTSNLFKISIYFVFNGISVSHRINNLFLYQIFYLYLYSLYTLTFTYKFYVCSTYKSMLILNIMCLFIFCNLRFRACTWAGEGQRERDTQTLHWAQSLMRGSISRSWDHDLSRN